MLGDMGGDVSSLTSRDAASLLGWWLEAGVDTAIAEQPRQWLRNAAVPLSGEVTPQTVGNIMSSPPDTSETRRGTAAPATLEAFHGWLRETSDLPLFRAGAARALPHGPAEAEIMLVAGLPDREDATAGRPIAGEAWDLAVKMLRAIGIGADAAYVASLACFPSSGARLGSEEVERCAETMRQHVAMVRPKRLLLLGDGPARALTGQPMVQARGRIHRVSGVPAAVTFHPRQLLQRPSDKAHAWRDLLLLMGEEIS